MTKQGEYSRVLASIFCLLIQSLFVGGLVTADAAARPIGYLSLYPQFGEFVDVGQNYANFSLSRGGGGAGAIMYRMVCDPRAVKVVTIGRDIHITATIELGDVLQPGYARCPEWEPIGELAAGTYAVTADFVYRSGERVDSDTQTVVIEPSGGKCNSAPSINSIIVLHKTLSADGLKAAAQADPAMADLLSHPISYQNLTIDTHRYAVLYYPPLESPIVIAGKMSKSDQFFSVEVNSLFCVSPSTNTIASMVEFFNSQTHHYFYTAELPEIIAIDRGAAGQGWTRTGKTFDTVTQPACPIPDPGKYGPVYRFYGAPQTGGSNTHFLTVSRQECHSLKTDSRWRFESIPFWAGTPVVGTCSSTTTPLYRAYNGRWRENDSNHRYSTERAVIEQMVQQGWIDEGTVMCLGSPSNQ